jgi:hypothetical protein
MLTGVIEQKPFTLAILDHPRNVGFPTYWMARGYGLFAANPLGRKAYAADRKEPDARELNFTLAPGQSVTFRYRLLIVSSASAPERIEAQYRRFASEVK